MSNIFLASPKKGGANNNQKKKLVKSPIFPPNIYYTSNKLKHCCFIKLWKIYFAVRYTFIDIDLL